MWISRLLDLLFPPLCAVCGEPTGAAHALCAACWGKIRFIHDPCCACCGLPFDVDVGAGALCPSCLNDPPLYVKARSVVVYDDASKPLVLGLKHADKLHLARMMGRGMANIAQDLVATCDVLVPVPLHRWRLFSRRYNQAALLADVIAKETGKPADPLLLRRVRATPSQGHRKKAERKRNVAGAFAVAPSKQDSLNGKIVLLIDDVMTTGATVDACASALLKAGAMRVSVLTYAKVVLT